EVLFKLVLNESSQTTLSLCFTTNYIASRPDPLRGTAMVRGFRDDPHDRLRDAGSLDARFCGYVVAGLSGLYVFEPHGMLRMYETFGNGGANTMKRTIGTGPGGGKPACFPVWS